MKCPHCDELLVITDRQGIEIDYCPKCRGVCLDRGELDKIIERSASSVADNRYPQTGQPNNDTDANFRNETHIDPSKPYRKKRGGFMENLFDFD